MNRRETIKAVGAFLVAPSLMKPFRGNTENLHPPARALDRAQLRLRMHTDPLHELQAYRSALVGPRGELWRGPRVLEVNRDPSGTPIHFKMQPIKSQETCCTITGIRLYHPSGEWRAESQWSGGEQNMSPGDTLNADLDFNLFL